MRAQRLVELVRPVAGLARSIDFYTLALGFTKEPAPDAYALLPEAWGATPRAFARLRLGQQTLMLAECETTLPDSGAEDTRFQHIAIIASDMALAWQRLGACGPLASISQGGPQQLPASSGGVSAVKFRDPDGHPLELLAFPAGAVPEQWALAGGPTLGIDHSAISVADAEVSVAFYAGRMGLSQASRQLNQGAEQARLDGLDAPVVDVVGLQPARPTPHLELLGYRPARRPLASASGPRSTTVWSGAATPSWLVDPDGHPHLLIP